MKIPGPRYRDGKRLSGTGGESIYTPDVIPIIRNAILTFGANIVEIAKLLGVERKTVYSWRKQHPELEEAILDAIDAYNAGKVENTLRRRAMGYYYTETTSELLPEPDKKTGKPRYQVTKRYRKYMPPDVVALKFWLSCRRPDRWREVKAIEVDPGPKADRLAARLQAALDRLGQSAMLQAKEVVNQIEHTGAVDLEGSGDALN